MESGRKSSIITPLWMMSSESEEFASGACMERGWGLDCVALIHGRQDRLAYAAEKGLPPSSNYWRKGMQQHFLPNLSSTRRGPVLGRLLDDTAVVGRIPIKFQCGSEVSHLLDDSVEDVLMPRAIYHVAVDQLFKSQSQSVFPIGLTHFVFSLNE